MKSFNSVYKKQNEEMLAEQQVVRDAQKSQIVSAIKKEFGINDFGKLSEEDRASYRSMINEMWNNKEGITEKGKLFLNEAAMPLTKDTTPEQIEAYFKKKIKANASKCVMSLISGGACDLVVKLVSNIEEKTGKKLTPNKLKKWMFDVCGKFLGESIKEMNLDSVNEISTATAFNAGGKAFNDGRYNQKDMFDEYVVNDIRKGISDVDIDLDRRHGNFFNFRLKYPTLNNNNVILWINSNGVLSFLNNDTNNPERLMVVSRKMKTAPVIARQISNVLSRIVELIQKSHNDLTPFLNWHAWAAQ